jgi:hypothetical protein
MEASTESNLIQALSNRFKPYPTDWNPSRWKEALSTRTDSNRSGWVDAAGSCTPTEFTNWMHELIRMHELDARTVQICYRQYLACADIAGAAVSACAVLGFGVPGFGGSGFGVRI